MILGRSRNNALACAVPRGRLDGQFALQAPDEPIGPEDPSLFHCGERGFGWLLDPRADASPVILDRIGRIPTEFPAPVLPQRFSADRAQSPHC